MNRHEITVPRCPVRPSPRLYCEIPLCTGSGNRLGAALIVSLGLSGCLNPYFTRFPTWVTGTPAQERRESQYLDPFPDSQLGPATDARPPQFDQQRPLPVRTRENFEISRFRQQVGTPAPVSPGPGGEYPQVVPF